jgi:hypothetical protein
MAATLFFICIAWSFVRLVLQFKLFPEGQGRLFFQVLFYQAFQINLRVLASSIHDTGKIENAKELLTKNFTISDCCFKVGFDIFTSFSGLFRKIEGKTPSE